MRRLTAGSMLAAVDWSSPERLTRTPWASWTDCSAHPTSAPRHRRSASAGPAAERGRTGGRALSLPAAHGAARVDRGGARRGVREAHPRAAPSGFRALSEQTPAGERIVSDEPGCAGPRGDPRRDSLARKHGARVPSMPAANGRPVQAGPSMGVDDRQLDARHDRRCRHRLGDRPGVPARPVVVRRGRGRLRRRAVPTRVRMLRRADASADSGGDYGGGDSVVETSAAAASATSAAATSAGSERRGGPATLGGVRRR